MKAVQINSYGSFEFLSVKEDAAIPSLQENQVLVKVEAAAINPFDVKLVLGMFKDAIPLQLPFTPGGDFAGKVFKTGSGVTEFKTGDEVYGGANILSGGSGAFAEYALVKNTNLALKPAKLDFTKSASLPLAGVSALQALTEHIQLKKGQKILIHGGAGGIGSLAVQIAGSIGAMVAVTVSADDKEYVEKLGADVVIDYKKENFALVLKEYDAVYDTVGIETANQSLPILKKGGILVSMTGEPDQKSAQKLGLTAIAQQSRVSSDRLRKLTELVEAGKITPQIDKIFPLSHVKEAFQHQKEGHPRGKVLLTM